MEKIDWRGWFDQWSCPQENPSNAWLRRSNQRIALVVHPRSSIRCLIKNARFLFCRNCPPFCHTCSNCFHWPSEPCFILYIRLTIKWHIRAWFIFLLPQLPTILSYVFYLLSLAIRALFYLYKVIHKVTHQDTVHSPSAAIPHPSDIIFPSWMSSSVKRTFFQTAW